MREFGSLLQAEEHSYIIRLITGSRGMASGQVIAVLCLVLEPVRVVCMSLWRG